MSTDLLSRESLNKLWNNSKLWRNLVIGAIIVKVSAKWVGAGMQFAFEKYLDVPPPKVKYEKDVVYLHMFPRNLGKAVPNISPFAMKLETWLRVHKIKYQVLETSRSSTKTKQIPYIIFNGEEYAESNVIIRFLSNYFNIDENDGLSSEDWAIARAMSKMVDEDLSWTYFLPRYVYDIQSFGRFFKFPPDGSKFVADTIKTFQKDGMIKKAYMQGIGRLSQEQVAEIGKDDVRAVSRFLGKKEYLLGSKITKVDCSVFGHLCQIVYVDFPYAHKELLDTECTNIMPYVERIREKYWPDWDQIVHKGEFS